MVENSSNLVDTHGCQTPHISSLTTSEQEVLDMITIKFYSLKQIQLARKCSRQAVYKILKSLKNKGYVNLSLQKVDSCQGSCQPCQPNQVRLHGQEFNIKLIWQDHRYQDLLLKSNIIYLDGHTIKLYRNSIEVYAGEGISFYGENEERADKDASEYWRRFFVKLEHNIKAIIIKEGNHNIKEVNHHYARGNSELCENQLKEQGNRIRVFCPIDGKLAFITDESFGDKEDETVHPKTAKADRKAIDKQVNDWRINNPPTSSELASHLGNTITQVGNIAGGFDNYGKHIQSHIQAIQSLNKGVRQLTRVMKSVLSENQSYKLSSKHQTTLGAFS